MQAETSLDGHDKFGAYGMGSHTVSTEHAMSMY